MKRGLNRALSVVVAMLFVAGSANLGTVISGRPMQAPDIVIDFNGLMVFENCTTGNHQQMVSLHSEADNHSVTVLIKGPGYPHQIQWGRAYPKGATLKLEVWNHDDVVPPSVTWGTKPYDMHEMHRYSATLGDFYRIPNAFGPNFTLNRGTFNAGSRQLIDFVSIVNKIPCISVPGAVRAEINFTSEQIAVLTAEGAPPGANLTPFPLPKPVGDTKWEIVVSNEPDSDHVYGYHFIEYYKGFRFRNGDVPLPMRYAAKPTPPGTVCTPKEQLGPFAIETRPCIPISY